MAESKANKPRIVHEDDSEITIVPGAQREESLEQSVLAAIPDEVAVLPVRGMVLFPGTVVPLAIGREKSRRLLDSVLPDQKVIVTICQKRRDLEDPRTKDLYDFGTAAMVLKLLRAQEGSQTIIVQGLARVQVK